MKKLHIIKKGSKQTLYKDLVRAYLDFLKYDAPKISPETVDLMNRNPEARIPELMRYTLCESLGCNVVENFTDMRPLYADCMGIFEKVLSDYSFTDDMAKHAVVQACLNCLYVVASHQRRM